MLRKLAYLNAFSTFAWTVAPFMVSRTFCSNSPFALLPHNCASASQWTFRSESRLRPVTRLKVTVLLLGCGIADIPLTVFISHMNGRLGHPSLHRKREWARFFSNKCGFLSSSSSFFVFFCRHFNRSLSVWHFMIGHLLSRAWLGVEWTSKKRALLDSSFSSSKKQKIHHVVAAEE